MINILKVPIYHTMKSTKEQTLSVTVTFGLKTPLHALGEHTGMKTELY